MLDRFTWFKQSAYRWRGDGITVYIDPWGVTAPEPADVVFITHAHYDHFSMEDIEKVRTRATTLVAPHDVAAELTGEVVPVKPGDAVEVAGVHAQAVPAYNVVEERLDKHPKENQWVGYVLTLGGSTFYHAGDTDHAPELNEVRADVAFLPIGGTYTCGCSEAASLAKAIGPQIAVPMHYGFVVGTPADAERFVVEAAPIHVATMTPEHPFEN